MNQKIATLIMIVSIPVAWLLIIEATSFPSFLIPPPILVGRVLVEETSLLWSHAKITLIQALVGYLIANAIAFSAAISFLYVGWLRSLATPWMVLIRNVPFVAFSSILIILFGESPIPKIIIVVLICYYTLMENINTGLRSVDQVLLDRLQVLNASTWQVFYRVRLPSALPYYLTALRITLPSSIMASVVAEWMYTRYGLGFLIQQSIMRFRADRLYAVVAVIVAASLTAFFAVQLLERRMLRWKQGE